MAKPSKKKSGPGRPAALDDGIQRPVMMSFRVSEQERDALRKKADRAGMPVGAFIIQALRKAGALPKPRRSNGKKTG